MQMTLLRRPDLWFPPLLLMGLIYLFSAQPSLDSGLGWVDAAGRKLIHFGEYALLCFLWWRALASVMPPGRALTLAAAICVAYAVSDEVHQTFIEGRHGSPVDVAIDTAGVAVSVALIRRRRL